MVFFVFFAFVVLQRIVELVIAKRNETRMKEKGAIEFGEGHYKYIVLLHISFLLSAAGEVLFFHKNISPLWPILLLAFTGTQLLRVWAISSLGPYWNTKIIVLPEAEIIKKGPYRFIRHPNYTVVILEILLIPLLFQAYFTAMLFSVLNIFVLHIRIQEEERVLAAMTNYEKAFAKISRFTP
ncbi:isoprenylcysteine carboxyl methyltransferase family protein [Ectobacillus panaciterrae]|uniref:isoprenylcysteine carboxyl methyltransferase family protein n=1 Tax=Ectobacillus panaciterrae TaxID=363872 RepID=UPI000413CE65|nr:isoprenylcysteine carboxylmethyltransferase family protein [Ectobacillus panaciterrae]